MSRPDERPGPTATRAVVQVWSSGRWPWWVPKLGLLLGSVVFVLASVDRLTTAVLVVPILLWFTRRLGCLVGIVAAVISVAVDPTVVGSAVSVVFALACALELRVLTASASSCRDAVAGVVGPTRYLLPRKLRFPGPTYRLLAAVLLVGLGLVGVLWYAVPVGNDVLGPADRLGLSGAAFVLATLIAWREVTVWRWIRRAPGQELQGLRVLVDRQDGITSTRANLYAVDAAVDDIPFATLDAVPAPWPSSARKGGLADGEPELLVTVWRSELEEFVVVGLVPGVLVGDLRPSGLSVVLLADAVLWPFRSLRPSQEPPSWWPDVRPRDLGHGGL